MDAELTYPGFPLKMDRVDRPEGRGKAGETPDASFHPSRPSGFGYLDDLKALP